MKPISGKKQADADEVSVIGPRRRGPGRRPPAGGSLLSRFSASTLGRGTLLGVSGLLIGYVFATRVVFPPASAPDDLVKVPDLIGDDLTAVTTRLEGLGLLLGAVDSVKHPAVAGGSVFGQSPLPGQRAQPGSVVRLTVSAGRQEVRVPTLAGAPADQAIALLEASGFEVQLDSVESAASRGSVVGLIPEEGDVVELPALVQVQVSLGPPLVAVPRLIGLSEEDATAQLEALGLMVSDVEVRFRFGLDQGKVIEQEPAPGRQIEEGSGVRLVVGRKAREGGEG